MAESFRERGEAERASPTVQRPEEDVFRESGEDDTLGQSLLTDEEVASRAMWGKLREWLNYPTNPRLRSA